MRNHQGTRSHKVRRRGGAGLATVLALFAGSALAQTPQATPEPGKPLLMIASYDLGALGYQTDEFFVSGTATSYKLAGPATADGVWDASPDAQAPYKTRIVVIRPSDPAKFNGTVLVEWLNVTAGQDTPPDWMEAHREIIRKGYAYVAVSAQKVGVEGGQSIMGMGTPLKKADPQRYGTLSHPGDAFSYDIFSQAGALVKSPGAGGVLGPLVPKHVLALGESQSAAFLTTYVNAVDPIAKVYDGILIHSRFGGGSPIDGNRMVGAPSTVPEYVRFRPDLRVPLLTVISETDLLGARISGYHAARRPDDALLRVWEVPGAAHADAYQFGGAFIDSGKEGSATLAKIFAPNLNSPMGKMVKPVNPGLVQHYVIEAAIASLDHWVRTGKPPASMPAMQLATGGTPGVKPSIARDDNGLALGGVRTPWVDVPTVRLSGAATSDGFLAMLVGSGEPIDAATLTKLYPGGKAEYLKRFTAALDKAIAAGHILPDDRQEILDVAAINYGAGT